MFGLVLKFLASKEQQIVWITFQNLYRCYRYCTISVFCRSLRNLPFNDMWPGCTQCLSTQDSHWTRKYQYWRLKSWLIKKLPKVISIFSIQRVYHNLVAISYLEEENERYHHLRCLWFFLWWLAQAPNHSRWRNARYTWYTRERHGGKEPVTIESWIVQTDWLDSGMSWTTLWGRILLIEVPMEPRSRNRLLPTRLASMIFRNCSSGQQTIVLTAVDEAGLRLKRAWVANIYLIQGSLYV